jgi:hypothetical protein
LKDKGIEERANGSIKEISYDMKNVPHMILFKQKALALR